MTPKTIRSQLSGLVKLEIGRVRRRTSRKARSMTLVVRTLIFNVFACRNFLKSAIKRGWRS